MDFFEVIKNRRSIRKFSAKKVSDEIVLKILDTARYSPYSNYLKPEGVAHNHQPWEFIIVRDKKAKESFAKPRDKANKFIADAPVVIAVCVDKNYSKTRFIEDGCIAAENILLAAHALGLGTAWMCAYSPDNEKIEKSVREPLNLPENIQPIVLISIGYPDERPKERKLRELKEMIRLEKW